MLMRRRRGARSALWLAAGLGAGVAVGWLTAPRRGDWLRNQIRQKFAHWSRLGRRGAARQVRGFQNKVRGAAAEVREAWSGPERYVDANTLVDQVHSHIGREFHELLENVNLNGVDHTIYLHGYVPAQEDRERLVGAVRGVEGVEAVRDEYLRVGAIPLHNEPSNQPENEPGGELRRAPRAETRPRRRPTRRPV